MSSPRKPSLGEYSPRPPTTGPRNDTPETERLPRPIEWRGWRGDGVVGDRHTD